MLKAKDELKWIDRTINSRDTSHKSRSTKRRLLWSRGEHAVKRKRSQAKRHAAIRDDSDDKSVVEIGDRGAANEVDIETILDDLGFSGENSQPPRNLEKNVHVERRRYPISDLTGTGIIEYYDYEGEVGKRDSSDSLNSTGAIGELNAIILSNLFVAENLSIFHFYVRRE